MNYVDRKGTCSFKWDGLKKEFGEADLLAMWVADMDFPSPPCVQEALRSYIETPMGYFSTPDSYYNTVIKWEKEHHGYEIKREWICVTPGIVPALHWAVRTFTKPGDSVMISTPVYYPFMNAIHNSPQRRLVKCELKKTGTYYEMDFEQFEKDIIANEVKLYILCNPHNPVGRVWTAEELRQTLEICKRHHVMVISDEIHQDIINPKLGRKKVTAATVGDYSDMLITMASASKSFNLAAVQNSFIIIPNDEIRESFDDFLRIMALDDVNGFGHVATQAAFLGGEAWLKEVLALIYDNFAYLKQRFESECPRVKISELEGTYLVWMDFGAFCTTQEDVKELIQHKCKIAMDYGGWFGSEDGKAFARMNIATSRENIKEACDRILAELAKR
ncbi:MAG: MalY/PatB family protein, partial [Ruthenibacterium sp.]